jgi:hypothetical protein
MRTPFLIGLAPGIFVAGVWACSSNNSSPPYPDVQSFCNAKAKAECQIAALCAIDATNCENVRAALCVQDGSSATASGTRKYAAGNAQACIDAVNAAYGNNASKIPFDKLVGAGSLTDKCERVWSGSADKGQSCQSDYECAGSRICAPAGPGATVRVCADSVQKNQGDFCSDPGSMCATDTFCTAQDGGAAQCLPAAQPGQPCGAAPCVSADRCMNGFCIVRAKAGEACVTNDDCAAAAPFCDPYAQNICTIGLTFATGAADCHGYAPGVSDAGPSSGASPEGGNDASSNAGPADAGGDGAAQD